MHRGAGPRVKSGAGPRAAPAVFASPGGRQPGAAARRMPGDECSTLLEEHDPRIRACEEITPVRPRGRGDPDFAQAKACVLGKIWIPASAGMSGWRFLHTRIRGGKPTLAFARACFSGSCSDSQHRDL